MTDKIIERRKSTDRRKGGDRRRAPRRMSDVYPPPNSQEWKRILYDNIEHFANKYVISLTELSMLVGELIDLKDKNEYP
jgi:hypothetical protein